MNLRTMRVSWCPYCFALFCDESPALQYVCVAAEKDCAKCQTVGEDAIIARSIKCSSDADLGNIINSFENKEGDIILHRIEENQQKVIDMLTEQRNVALDELSDIKTALRVALEKFSGKRGDE